MRYFLLLFLGLLVFVPRVSLADSTPEPNIRWTFEDASILPAKKDTYSRLNVKNEDGRYTNVFIGYEAGKPFDRMAEIVPDPTNPSNKVLRYWMKNARVPGQRKGHYKGRIQLNVNKTKFTEFSQRYRMYIPSDLELYRSYPKENGWFNFTELWFGAPDHPYRFKIALNIGKREGVGQPLLFLASGASRIGGRPKHGKWKDEWFEVNSDFEIPTGKWLNLELGYKQGDKASGRFFMSVQEDGQDTKKTLFDITDWTYNPKAKRPVALTMINPLKLYTSSRIVDHVRNNGGVSQIYWDDLEMWDEWIY